MAKPPAKTQFVADQLAIRIAAGDYQPGQWLPGGQAIGDELGADRGTVRSALRMLEERGLVEVVKGNGARVRPRTVTRHNDRDMVENVGQWLGFGAAVAREGKEPYADVVRIAEVEAPSSAARWLGVPIGTTVLLRDRTQGWMEEEGPLPAQIARTWITMPCVERLPVLREKNTGPGGMTERFREAGYVLSYDNTAIARHADAAEQERLRVGPNHPVIDVWRRTYDQDRRIVKASNRVVNTMHHGLEW
jgi:GntR family transcriptional regulator